MFLSLWAELVLPGYGICLALSFLMEQLEIPDGKPLQLRLLLPHLTLLLVVAYD